jgi:dihydropteroate synthase
MEPPTSRHSRSRASRWQLRTRTLHLPARPALMGIVNVTPDSFSDGGRYFDTEAAVEHGRQLIVEGAHVIDVGGESTRPGASPITTDEELRRVLPVIKQLASSSGVTISIDTSKAEVARAAIDAGAEIINDVTGLTGDPEMVDVAVRTGAGVVVMHMQGTPRTMQKNPTYTDVVAEVRDYLRQRRDALVTAGVQMERICLDPGIGFGKTFQHNLLLIRNCETLHELGCPVLVGHSRKSFLGRLIHNEQADRTSAALGVAFSLAMKGVQILRVHDVRAVSEALTAVEETGGLQSVPADQ